jgi:hypothetical protein
MVFLFQIRKGFCPPEIQMLLNRQLNNKKNKDNKKEIPDPKEDPKNNKNKNVSETVNKEENFEDDPDRQTEPPLLFPRLIRKYENQ